MDIATGQTTEWVRPGDLGEVLTFLAAGGYVLSYGEVFVVARSEEDWRQFHATYLAGVEARDA